jgi:threonine/homoserine efflux transporter RhtA
MTIKSSQVGWLRVVIAIAVLFLVTSQLPIPIAAQTVAYVVTYAVWAIGVSILDYFTIEKPNAKKQGE